MPETPVWLISHNREDDAKKALRRLRGKYVFKLFVWLFNLYWINQFTDFLIDFVESIRRTDIEAEFQRMKENQAKNSQQQQIQPRELLKGSVLKPLGISMGIMFFQQFTGINAMIFYTVSIFKSAGTTLDGRYATIIIGFVQLIATASSGFLVKKKHLFSTRNKKKNPFCQSFWCSVCRWTVLDVVSFYFRPLWLFLVPWQLWDLSSTCKRNGDLLWPLKNLGGYRCFL